VYNLHVEVGSVTNLQKRVQAANTIYVQQYNYKYDDRVTYWPKNDENKTNTAPTADGP